ncbi:MAG: glucose-6-phosphate dehydrogenase [Candidatus Andersenbacteria bacterium]|nr:glucose-6-phosphate dehydrogenase [Candidatus Andersenbacteria bacterium]MBI3251237.1 glucose-6-phosphate dehydrogenase [Candidatus Andersenbacteria bacterium]
MSQDTKSQLPTVYIMFGATGDLARRKLIPALFALYKKKLLPALFQVVGFSRSARTDAEFQTYVAEITGSKEFAQLFYYRSGLFEDPTGYKDLAKLLGKQDKEWHTCANKLFHLAVPPQYYQTIFQNLDASGLTEPCGPDEGWTRVIVEKPFGKDLTTAQELDLLLGKLFREEQIFRIDHYLGKETARNILAFRFSNTFLQPSWDSRSIESVHVHFPEESDLEGRGSFYDGVGALRDVGQNHMLQLLALFLMDNPGQFDADSIRRERTRVLEALEVMDEQDIIERTVRGQYEGYKETEKIDSASQTETFFHIQTHVNLPKWHGVPIFLEHGKALNESKFEIFVNFRHHTPCLCPPGQHYKNELRYRVQPDEGIFTSFWVKKPGTEMKLEQKDFSFDYHRAYDEGEFLDAYVKLLLDAINGDQTLFVSTDEITASWRFTDPIVRAWQAGLVPLIAYPKGADRQEVLKRAPTPKFARKQIGYIGLGKMGASMVERLLEHEWEVVAHDPDKKARERVAAIGAKAAGSASEVVDQLRSPRIIWLMVPHQVVDEVLKEITPKLAKEDIVIDGGNTFYKDSVKRAQELSNQGIRFLDVGVSGGPKGARLGACLMIGGPYDAYKRMMGLFNDIASAGGYDYMGKSGSGHFVKMIHNGIEYGMMQAISEGFAVLKNWPEEKLDLERIASLFNHGSVIESRLIGWLKNAYDKYGLDLDEVSGEVAHSGEGRWTVEAAKELGIPAPVIERALQFRVDSEDNPSYSGKILSALRNQFGGHSIGKLK